MVSRRITSESGPDPDGHQPTGVDRTLICLTDLNGIVVYVNPPFAEVFGPPSVDPKGRSFTHLVHPDDLGIGADSLASLADGGEVIGLQLRLRCRDGSYRSTWWDASVDLTEGVAYGVGHCTAPSASLEASVTSSDAQMRAVDEAGIAVFTKDLEGRYLYANRAMLDGLGCPADEVIGRTVADLWTGQPPGLNDAEREVVRSRGPVRSDETVPLPDGTRTFVVSRVPVLAADGQIAAICGVATDITGRHAVLQKLADRDRLLDAVLAACPDGIVVFDADGRPRMISAAVKDTLGPKGSRQVGLPEASLVHPDDVVELEREYAKFLSGEWETLATRYRVHHRDGRWVEVEDRGRQLIDEQGRRTGSVVVARDVSGQIAMEEALRKAVLQAESANEAKSEFLSRMSHELRTPLTAILGFGQLLEADDLPPDSHAFVEHIVQAGRHLLSLIDEVLDIARIETSQVALAMEPVAVHGVVEEAISLAKPMAESLALTISVLPPEGAPLYVAADQRRIRQVVLNLVTNAVKYNRPHGDVAVSWTAVDGQRCRFVVSDTGVGIRPEDLDRIFEPFTRAVSPNCGIDGNGVGLAVVQQLVNLMGGTLGAESWPDVGSQFWFELALAEPSSGVHVEAAMSRGHRHRSSTLHVLHIEDNPAVLQFFETALQRWGPVSTYVAMNGQAGLEAASEQDFDVILLDMHLPDLTGIEILTALRGAGSTTPVVIATADASAQTRATAERLGVHAFLTKPVDLDQLFETLDAVP